MIYIAIITLVFLFYRSWTEYHLNKDKLALPLKELMLTIDSFVNNSYVKFTMSLVTTILALTLIFLSFSACFCMWVLKFNQSTVGLCVSLFLFSVLLLGSVFWIVTNQDLIDQ
jgi:hypothetical protein